VEWLQQLLQGRDREVAAPTFAAGGLYLAGVEYDAQWHFPARVGRPLPSLVAAQE
jgi:tRNA pseudouridine38-40 synthase